MDKFKSNKWVGNICNRFESICQDVDDFISKKTVKYVEDQVQNVGLNVTQFYSGVVEDILPMLEDNIKYEESAITDKEVHTEDSLNSTMGVKEKPVNMHEKTLSMEQGSIDTQRNGDTLMPSELDLLDQCTSPPAKDPLEEEESDMPLEQDGDSIISNNNADTVVVENSTRDLMPSESDDIDHNNAMQAINSSQAPLVNEFGFMALPEEGNLSESERNSDYTECASDISSNGWECELNLPEFEDSNFDDDRSSSLPPAILVEKSEKDVPLSDNFSSDHECINGSSNVKSPEEADNKSEKDVSLSDKFSTGECELSLPEVEDSNFDDDRSSSLPPAILVDKSEKDVPLSDNFSTEHECINGSSNVKSSEEADNKSEKDVSLSDKFSTEDECLNGSSNVQSPEEADNKSDKDVSLFDSISTQGECLNGRNNVQSSEEADNGVQDLTNSHVGSIECIDDKSSGHTSSKASITSLLGSNDVESPTTHGSVSLVAEVCCGSSQSSMLISTPTENGSVDRLGGVISDPLMESVDLSNGVEHDGNCAIVNGNPSYRASCGGRNFRYYKNLIKDAFGSHKRITKEYEHLGILYGDIDEELQQHFEPGSLPSSFTSSSVLPRSPSHTTSESDWELL